MSFIKTTNNNFLDYTGMFKHNKYLKPVVITSYTSSIDFDVNEYDVLILHFDGSYQNVNVNFVNDSNSLEGKRIFIVNVALANVYVVNAGNFSIGAVDDKKCFKRGSTTWTNYES